MTSAIHSVHRTDMQVLEAAKSTASAHKELCPGRSHCYKAGLTCNDLPDANFEGQGPAALIARVKDGIVGGQPALVVAPAGQHSYQTVNYSSACIAFQVR